MRPTTTVQFDRIAEAHVDVAVAPASAWAARRRLFDALGAALGVRFVPEGDGTPHAVVRFGVGSGDGRDLPAIVLPDTGPRRREEVAAVAFAESHVVHRSVRGAVLQHAVVEPLDDLPRDGEVLATLDGRPVWIRAGSTERVAIGLEELAEGGTLRQRLSPHTFLPLLPLVDFVRRSATAEWERPALRAAFLLDDPNLHATTYGYVDYKAAVEEAGRHGFHLALATIPLDCWYASPAAVRLFRGNGALLSLVVHGNDHLRRELARPLTPDERRALLVESLARVERFERRYGLAVGRVMAPPHGACSEEMAAEMLAVGFEALCVSRPHPWSDEAPGPLAGWNPAENVADGLPLLPRLHFSANRDEVALRAFLGQPVVLFGHHTDLRDGLGILVDAVGQVRAAGDATWGSLDEALGALHVTRRSGSRLRLRLYARRAKLELPPGIDEVLVEPPDSAGEDRLLVVTAPPVEQGGLLELRLERPQPAPVSGARRFAAWPYVRRGLSETRDRLLPLLRR